ncbi:MAG: serine hydrolase [bacterium]|nr:serine hydrolase [bacterium]
MSDTTHTQANARRGLVIPAVLFFAGAAVGIAGGYTFALSGNTGVTFGEDLYQQHQYKFINPLLACNATDAVTSAEFRPLESELKSAIQRLAEGSGATVSLYFKELNSGHQTAINENTRYAPASLLKVPIMMAFYKIAEFKPEILARTLTYAGSVDLNLEENFMPDRFIQPGKTYTVAELIEYMVIDSDNNAMMLLREVIDELALNEVFIDLGLTVPTVGDDPDFINVKNYSRFFRVLYHATYLSRESSEKALELLTRDKPFKGIVGGVPSDVTVAQKFGERGFVTSSGDVTDRELHDCGIVYDPDGPYLLCVMTKGRASFEKLTDIIRKISTVVYEYRRRGA